MVQLRDRIPGKVLDFELIVVIDHSDRGGRVLPSTVVSEARQLNDMTRRM
jgi:hypothetical protein